MHNTGAHKDNYDDDDEAFGHQPIQIRFTVTSANGRFAQ